MSVTATYRGLDKLNPEFKQQVDNWFNEVVTINGKRLKVSEVIFLTETTRSKERQKYLYDHGLSYLNGTAPSISKHQEGLAVDIAFNGDSLYPQTSDTRWRIIADAAKKHGIDWGYDLWAWDAAHFQDARGSYMPPPPDYGKPIEEWKKPVYRKAVKKGINTDLSTVLCVDKDGKKIDIAHFLLLIEKYQS